MNPFRKILSCFLLCATLWLGGLVWFTRQIPVVPSGDQRRTDAIVVLTGGSERLEYGLRLLAEGRSDKLFISGVSRKLTMTDILRHATPAVRQKLQAMTQHITLGHEAENTIGNAEETARWLKQHQCHSIGLVTANYHMPRSIEEFNDTAPGIAVVPEPVFPDDFQLNGWWWHTESRHLLLSEYHKYVAAALRHWLVSIIKR